MADQTVLERRKNVETSIGTLSMAELQIDDIQFILSDLVDLYKSLDKDVMASGDGLQILLAAIRNKHLVSCIKNIIARSSGVDKGVVADLGIRDTIRLAKGFLEVNPIREIYDLFLDLKELLVGQMAKVPEAPEAPEAVEEEKKTPAE